MVNMNADNFPSLERAKGIDVMPMPNGLVAWKLDFTGFAFPIYKDTFCFLFCGPLISFVYILKQVVEYMRG